MAFSLLAYQSRNRLLRNGARICAELPGSSPTGSGICAAMAAAPIGASTAKPARSGTHRAPLEAVSVSNVRRSWMFLMALLQVAAVSRHRLIISRLCQRSWRSVSPGKYLCSTPAEPGEEVPNGVEVSVGEPQEKGSASFLKKRSQRLLLFLGCVHFERRDRRFSDKLPTTEDVTEQTLSSSRAASRIDQLEQFEKTGAATRGVHHRRFLRNRAVHGRAFRAPGVGGRADRARGGRVARCG